MLKFTPCQHKKYLHFKRKLGDHWLDMFDGNTEFYSVPYWDLLTEMWYADKPMMVSDALRFMRSIKSPFTARKYLQRLIDENMVIETKNPKDERSILVGISPEMKAKLDKHFDFTIGEMLESVKDIALPGCDESKK